MLHPNDTIGPYTLIRLLGRGGFGEVWLAEKRGSLVTAPVALKLPLLDTDAVETVRKEAVHWLRASGHPNVVPFLDADVYDGQVVIASEYIAGGSLKDRMETAGGKPWPPEETVALIGGVLAGLDYLHRAGLTHRDLKPDNVLLQEGTPRLADFGLARVLTAEARTGNISGTPRYMAPETFSGAYSVQSDLWAVSVMLYELLTGFHPFPQTDFMALITAITNAEPTPIVGALSSRLRSVVTRMLAKSPGDRFATASAVREALQSALRPNVTAGNTQLARMGYPDCTGNMPGSPVQEALPPHNLPAQTSSFIGREHEIDLVTDLLASHRLVTLTGAGGSGKTRLSLQIAARVLTRFDHGVWTTELAPISDPAFVVSAAATVFEVKEEPGRPLIKTLSDALMSKRLLLILDNCEHVLAAAAALADTLLRSCPNLNILVTSREALNIEGEQNFRVPSLNLPNSSEMDLDTLLASESVRLFVDRAKAVSPGFTISLKQTAMLSSILRRLDGIPLAIELAAARTRSLSLEQLSARLDDRFRLLTGGSRTALPRQQTLRAMIDWSYALLTEPEKSLFCRLSVFSGGWTLAAAETVCSGEDLEGWEVLDHLAALVDKSLVDVEVNSAGTRYRFLETVRQYAGEAFSLLSDASRYRRQHAEYFVSLAEEAIPELRGPRQAEWLDRLETEHDNLRAALRWGRDGAGADTGLRLCGALWWFWSLRGYWTEGREWCSAALRSERGQQRSRARADALYGAGGLASEQSDYAAARAYYEESLAIFQEVGDRNRIGGSLSTMGFVAYLQGDFASARNYQEASLALRREIGDNSGVANSLNNLGIVYYAQGDYATARAYYEQGLAMRREIGDRNGIAASLCNLGIVADCQGDYSSARSCYEESLAIFREVGNRNFIGKSLNGMGDIAFKQGDYTSSRAYFEESLAIGREIGDRSGIGNSLGNLGGIAFKQCDYASARAYNQESLAIFREIVNRGAIAESLGDFAALAAEERDADRAATLWAAALALREAIGAPMPPSERERYDTAVARARSALGEEAFAAAWERGRGMIMETAVAFALGETE